MTTEEDIKQKQFELLVQKKKNEIIAHEIIIFFMEVENGKFGQKI